MSFTVALFVASPLRQSKYTVHPCTSSAGSSLTPQRVAIGTVEQPRWGMPLAGTSRRRRSSGERSSIAASVSTQFLARLWITRCTCSTRGPTSGSYARHPNALLLLAQFCFPHLRISLMKTGLIFFRLSVAPPAPPASRRHLRLLSSSSTPCL